MKTELPTKPGPYYWREKDGDEWQLVCIEIHIYNRNPDVVHLSCYSGKEMRMLPIKDMGGQWLPIPTADELVELQAAKKMMTDLVRAAKKVEGMLEPLNQRDDKHARDFSKAISACEPVTIIRKAKR